MLASPLTVDDPTANNGDSQNTLRETWSLTRGISDVLCGSPPTDNFGWSGSLRSFVGLPEYRQRTWIWWWAYYTVNVFFIVTIELLHRLRQPLVSESANNRSSSNIKVRLRLPAFWLPDKLQSWKAWGFLFCYRWSSFPLHCLSHSSDSVYGLSKSDDRRSRLGNKKPKVLYSAPYYTYPNKISCGFPPPQVLPSSFSTTEKTVTSNTTFVLAAVW